MENNSLANYLLINYLYNLVMKTKYLKCLPFGQPVIIFALDT